MTVWTFQNGTQLLAIKLVGNVLLFADHTGQYAPIGGLKLNIAGILKDNPDLKGKSVLEIRREGIKRFQDKIKLMTSPIQLENYLISDLAKYGWKIKMSIKQGHRPKRYN